MSTAPSRTRSLRKPSEISSRLSRSYTSGPNDSHKTPRAETGTQSPSRLPMKPITRSSISTVRPPSATGSSVYAQPLSSRGHTSKPSTSGLHRSLSRDKANAPSRPDADPVKKDRSRPPIVTSRHLRNTSISSASSNSTVNTSVGNSRSSGHTRTKSSSTLLNSATSTVLRPPNRNSLQEPSSRHPHTESQLRRPAFSTLQQHFSPARNLAPKPHPAAFLAPPSPSKLPSNIAISAETAKLQNELLQLHLIHKDAGRVGTEWRASAKRKLGTKFQWIVNSNEELVQLEAEEIGKINAMALKKWHDQGAPGWGLDEKIQLLDEVISGVWNLGETGGKYARVIRKFERWVSRCHKILEAREREETPENSEIIFLEELDSGWKDDCLLMSRKLESWRGNLKALGSPDRGSSLGIVVEGCRNLVKGMLTELSMMTQIERDAMRKETEWIKTMNDDMMDDDNNMPTAGAVWRSR